MPDASSQGRCRSLRSPRGGLQLPADQHASRPGSGPTGASSQVHRRSEEHTSELQSPISTLFPYTTLFRSDAVRFVHHEVGYNYRLTNMQAALGVAQLEQVRKFIADRKSTRLNSSHRYLHSFPTRRSSDLMPFASFTTRWATTTG